MSPERALRTRRVRSALLENGLAAAVLGALFGLSRLPLFRRSRVARALVEGRHADVARFALSLGPVWLLWSALDVPGRRSPKAAAGLELRRRGGTPLGRARLLGRAGLKLLPWQVAHLAVGRVALAEPTARDEALGRAGFVLSLTAVAADAAVAWRTGGGRALHDVLARTELVPTSGRRAAGTA